MAANKYGFIAGGSTLQVSKVPGVLVSVFFSGSGEVKLYDTATGETTGTEVVDVKGSTGQFEAIPFDVAIQHGIYVVASEGVSVTVTYY